MNFKEAAKSGQFSWEMPEFVNRVEAEGANRMAGDYMKDYFKKTEYTPKKNPSAEQNMASFGIRSPFEQHIQDQQYKQMLADEKRRKDWK